MTSISPALPDFSGNLDQFNVNSSVKPLKSVPSGRPRGLRSQPNERKGEEKDVAVASTSSNQIADLDLDFDGLLAELRTELDVKRREEVKLQREITDILSESSAASTGGGPEQSSRAFSLAVSRLNNSLLVVEADSKQLAASLTTISRLADNISGKVSALDVAKTRVVECLQLSGDMRDLGVCSEGVDEAIRSEDYEQAAQHIHRFLTLDKAVFQLKDAADKEAGQSVAHSYQVLTSAATRLTDILEKKLDDAIHRESVPEMQRFVKLFPLLNQHDSGLTRFGKYLGGQIRKLGEDNIKIMTAGGTDDSRLNVLFADTIFLFFEGVAALLEANQPLIHNSYGPDKLLDFINLLQRDNDFVVGKILEAFSKKRQIDKYTRTARKLLRETTLSMDRLDPLELDGLLSEMCLMNTHSEMYWRFVRRRLGETAPGGAQKQEEFVIVGEDDSDDLDEEAKKKREEERERRKKEREKKLDQLLHRSVVGTKMQELLGQYILLEQYYLEESVRKAIDMDCREEGLMSSVVDDVLFLVRKSVRRAMSSGSIDCVCAALNNGCALLETTYMKHLEIAIKTGYPSAGFAAEAFQTAQTAYNVIQHGKTVTEAGPDAQRELFLTAVNNMCGTAELVEQLKAGLHHEWTQQKQKERSSVEVGKLDSSLSQLDEVSRKMANSAARAMQSLCHTAFTPKLKTSCELYLDLPHSLSESQFAEWEAVDPFIEHFDAQLDHQIAYFEPLLLKQNYQNLLLCVCAELGSQLERVILRCTFNRMGGLQLDKEFRQLSAYLSGVAGWAARERTSRLAQVVSLLNVESVEEAVELWEASGAGSVVPSRALSPQEAKKVLLLRNDLPAHLVQQLHL